MSVMNTSQFKKLKMDGETSRIAKVFFEEYKQNTGTYTQILNDDPMTMPVENDHTMAGFGSIGTVAEGETITHDTLMVGYDKQYKVQKRGLGAYITYEMLEDDKSGIMKKIPSALANAHTYQEEVEAAKIFNYGTATTYNSGADGLALFSASHTLIGGGTHSNISSTNIDLTVTGLDTAIQAIRGQVNDRNKLLMIKPSILLVPRELKRTAQEILLSPLKSGTANNDMNAFDDEGIRIVVWDHLTDADAWFLLADKKFHDLRFRWYEKPYDDEDETKNKQVREFMIWSRFVTGFTDWRGIWGSTGGGG